MRAAKLIIVGVFAAFFLSFQSGRYLLTQVEGQTGLGAPGRVTASEGSYATKIGLTWDAVRGANMYSIFRSTTNDPATAALLETTPGPYYFDYVPVANQQYFYWIRAENGTTTGPLSQSDDGFRLSGTSIGTAPLDPPPTAPAGNQLTAAKFTLGKILFWDEQLSSTQTVACGTCHRAGSGGSDPRTNPEGSATNPGFDGIFNTPDDIFASPGVPMNSADGLYQWSAAYGLNAQVTNRKAPSYIDSAYFSVLFWDGRATSVYRDPITNAIVLNGGGTVESQSSSPPINPAEMAHAGRDWNHVASQIASAKPLALSPNVSPSLKEWIAGRSYAALFEEAFGSPEVSPVRISMAIGSFERGLFSDRTPLDLANSALPVLSAQEQRGRNVFQTAQCSVCHFGNLLTDNQFHNIGVRPTSEDPGRFAVTGNAADLGEFRTPGLRNVELRGPYMHNGRFATLEDVVEFYNRGGDFTDAPNFPANLVRPRNLSPQQKADLVAFLKRPLTDPRVAAELPPFDRPALYTESDRVPVFVGTGTNGSGGQLPKAVAIEPPVSGNASFTVAVSNALGGANAVLVINSTDPGNTSNIPPSGSFTRAAVQLQGSGTGAGYGSVSLQIPNDPSLIGQTFFGRWYVADPGAANGVAVSQAFRFTVFGAATAALPRSRADFDGDGKTDLSVFSPATGNWSLLRSTAGAANYTWGNSDDVITPGDFDGDRKADVAVYRPGSGQWFILNSSNSTATVTSWGNSTDRPAAADFDGDGKADINIYRPSTGQWFLLRSSNGVPEIAQWGASGDLPVPANYDADAKTDIAVYRPSNGTWYVLQSSGGGFAAPWGLAGDKPTPADLDGDNKDDLAVYRPSEGKWYVFRSTDQSFDIVQWGNNTDVPTPGDYDGDGKDDYAVYRPATGQWFVLRSTAGLMVATWGSAADQPVPAAYIP